MKHFVEVCDGVWVNARQVCYVREGQKGDGQEGLVFVGFHGGVCQGGLYSNEIMMRNGTQTAEVAAKLEEALQEGGAE